MLRYRERYGLLQLKNLLIVSSNLKLRYRERYGLLQLLDCYKSMFMVKIVTIPRTVWTVATFQTIPIQTLQGCYDTANGMDCCNLSRELAIW